MLPSRWVHTSSSKFAFYVRDRVIIDHAAALLLNYLVDAQQWPAHAGNIKVRRKVGAVLGLCRDVLAAVIIEELVAGSVMCVCVRVLTSTFRLAAPTD